MLSTEFLSPEHTALSIQRGEFSGRGARARYKSFRNADLQDDSRREQQFACFIYILFHKKRYLLQDIISDMMVKYFFHSFEEKKRSCLEGHGIEGNVEEYCPLLVQRLPLFQGGRIYSSE